jgi:hypothetical protein
MMDVAFGDRCYRSIRHFPSGIFRSAIPHSPLCKSPRLTHSGHQTPKAALADARWMMTKVGNGGGRLAGC